MNTSALHVVFGTGQVGSQLVDRLLARGYRVRTVRRSAECSRRRLRSRSARPRRGSRRANPHEPPSVPVAIVVTGVGRRDDEAAMSTRPKVRTDVWLYVANLALLATHQADAHRGLHQLAPRADEPHLAASPHRAGERGDVRPARNVARCFVRLGRIVNHSRPDRWRA
jgi:uncharacterized protein YbjT (DUF2867 family)